MRIAYLTDTYSPEINGVVTSIKNFTEYFRDNGHEVLIIAPKYGRKKDPIDPRILIKRYPSFSLSSNKNTRIAYPSILSIISDLREFRPDIIHVQTPMSIGVAGVLAARILKVPCISSYHTYIPDIMVYLSPGKLLGLDRITASIASSKAWKNFFKSGIVEDIEQLADNIEKVDIIKAINKRLGRRRRRQILTDRFAWDFTRFIYNQSVVVITPSIALAKLLKRHRVKPPVLDVSNGINLSQITPKKSYAIRNRILNTGRLGVEGKNVDVVIKAFALAKKRRPELVLDIAGDGPAAAELKNLAAKLEVSDSVNFLGFVPNKTLLREYHKSDVFITASTMETQGLVILEAMAAGLPVIGVDALAVSELVKNNRNGRLVKPGNIKGLAESILALTESQTKNEKYGEAAIKMAQKNELSICANKLEHIYLDVLAKKSFNKKK